MFLEPETISRIGLRYSTQISADIPEKQDGRFRLENWPFYGKPEANFGLSFLISNTSGVSAFFYNFIQT
jgi:hypothetical protein